MFAAVRETSSVLPSTGVMREKLIPTGTAAARCTATPDVPMHITTTTAITVRRMVPYPRVSSMREASPVV